MSKYYKEKKMDKMEKMLMNEFSPRKSGVNDSEIFYDLFSWLLSLYKIEKYQSFFYWREVYNKISLKNKNYNNFLDSGLNKILLEYMSICFWSRFYCFWKRIGK